MISHEHRAIFIHIFDSGTRAWLDAFTRKSIDLIRNAYKEKIYIIGY